MRHDHIVEHDVSAWCYIGAHDACAEDSEKLKGCKCRCHIKPGLFSSWWTVGYWFIILASLYFIGLVGYGLIKYLWR